MFTIFNIYIFSINFCLKYFWIFLLSSTKLFAIEALPYPYLTYSSSIEFKGNEKFQLNTLINLDDAVVHVLLDDLTKLKLADANFSLKKLPDYYSIELSKGTFFISGKKKLSIVCNDTKLMFYEGEALFNIRDGKLKLLSNKNTKIEMMIDGKVNKLKDNSFYIIQKTVLESLNKTNFDSEITKVLDLNSYKRLIISEPTQEIQQNSIEKAKGVKIFCLEGDMGASINNWFINTDKNILLKKVLSEKHLKTCRDKFSNIIDAGEYEIGATNCMYINNLYCQKINVNSSVVLVKLAKVLLTGYDSIFIKNQDQTFYQVYDKWLFLSPGKYTLKLGRIVNNATIYDEKELDLKPGQTNKMSGECK